MVHHRAASGPSPASLAVDREEEERKTLLFLSPISSPTSSGVPWSSTSSKREDDQEFDDSDSDFSLDIESQSGKTGSNAFFERLGWRTVSSISARIYRDNHGLLLIIASQFLFSIVNMFVKMLSSLEKPVPALELIWIRMFITYFCGLGYMYLAKIEHPLLGPPGVRQLLVLRGVTGFVGLFGIYYSLQYLSLSDATVLTFLAPTATGVLGTLFLGEVYSKREFIAGVCSLAGVVLIARPEALFGPPSGTVTSSNPAKDVTPSQRMIAVGVSLLGVVGAAASYTVIRGTGKRVHTLHSLSYFSLYCIIVSSIMIPVLKVDIVIPQEWIFLALLLGIGVLGFFAQILLVLGLQNETASRGTMGVYTLILFIAVEEQLFLHTTPSLLSIIGAAVILTAAIYVALTKESEPTEKPTKHVHWEDGIEYQALEGVESPALK